MTRFLGRIGLIFTALLLALPAFATLHEVAVGNYFFNPANLTVIQGDTVRWTNTNGFHNVRHTGTPQLFGNSPASAPWTYDFVFDVAAGEYGYQCDVHPSSMSGIVTVEAANASPEPPAVVSKLQLEQNYPNPFNSQTTIQFSLPTMSHVKLTIMNELGQIVRVLQDGELASGVHRLSFDASGLSTGLYYYRIETSMATVTRKMSFLK